MTSDSKVELNCCLFPMATISIMKGTTVNNTMYKSNAFVCSICQGENLSLTFKLMAALTLLPSYQPRK